jgi:hypothetical protein
MPFKLTKFNYILTAGLFIGFIVSFFFLSRWGDFHYTSNPDPAGSSTVSIGVYLIPFFVIYEMFAILVLPGKKRIKEIDKKVLFYRLLFRVRNEIRKGWDDYHRWRKK